MSEVATSLQERPVFFPHGDNTLFGIITDPVGEPRGIGVILLYGGGYTMSSYYNQYWTRMTRRVAGLGFHAMRFDHHGNGDSTGRVDEFDHKTPFSADIVSAMDHMRSDGIDRFLLVGDCLGGRAALVAAGEEESVEGVFVISAMVRDGRMDKADDWAQKYGLGHYLKRALRWKSIRRLADPKLRKAYFKVASTKARQLLGGATGAVGSSETEKEDQNSGASRRFLGPLEVVLRRGGRVLFVFGDEDEERWGEFEKARGAKLGTLLSEAGSRAEVTKVAGTITDIQDVSAQDDIIDLVADWVAASR
jgi:pimeloyl-ACP methyl ester carboxylesterase